MTLSILCVLSFPSLALLSTFFPDAAPAYFSFITHAFRFSFFFLETDSALVLFPFRQLEPSGIFKLFFLSWKLNPSRLFLFVG